MIIFRSVIILRQPDTCLKPDFKRARAYILGHNHWHSTIRVRATFNILLFSSCRWHNVKTFFSIAFLIKNEHNKKTIIHNIYFLKKNYFQTISALNANVLALKTASIDSIYIVLFQITCKIDMALKNYI